MEHREDPSRRAFLRSTAGALLAGALGAGEVLRAARRAEAAAAADSLHLVWVWKFSVDGPFEPIRDTLSANRLGIILKTHDGTQWMSQYDSSPDAVSGPNQVAQLARKFENAGIPFHAWCVTQGEDPRREAAMCAQVLDAGARSIFLDLEPPEKTNYWQGGPSDAQAFGEELRRLKPNGQVTLAPDVRPWQAPHVPLAEFMSFCDAVAPQSYWVSFNGPTNGRYFREHGFDVGPSGLTPEMIVRVAADTFEQFGRPIRPIGQGAAPPDDWRRFIAAAGAYGMQPLSLWRYGTADSGAYGVLRDLSRTAAAPGRAGEPAAPEQPAPRPPLDTQTPVQESSGSRVETGLWTGDALPGPQPAAEDRLYRPPSMPSVKDSGVFTEGRLRQVIKALRSR